MRCTSPRTVGFKSDGVTLCWSPKKANKEYASFQLPCGKCISCRLEYARQWAIRCVHEASMHEKNCFITLTYSNENLKSDKLVYSDFQKFMKKIRKLQNDPIGVFVTGEYGEKTCRPHYHAILFNWSPPDPVLKYTSERGDRVFESKTLSDIWGLGIAEFGSVTIESAGYCARYAAKKLVHGNDGTHEYEPISKKSSKHAIGKKWLEKNWKDVFNHGKIVLANGQTCSIPRYYEKWFKENHPDDYRIFITTTKRETTELAQKRNNEIETEFWENNFERNKLGKSNSLHPKKIERIIQEEKFKMLQNHLKL